MYGICSGFEPLKKYLYIITCTNIGEIHYHKENKTNGGKQIEFSAESNQFDKKSKEIYSITYRSQFEFF